MAPAFNTDAYCQVGSRVPSPIASGSRANRREPNWREFTDQVIPGLPLGQTSEGNYVASEVVPCVFLAAPHPQRHITRNAT